MNQNNLYLRNESIQFIQCKKASSKYFQAARPLLEEAFYSDRKAVFTNILVNLNFPMRKMGEDFLPLLYLQLTEYLEST
jgi:hypothetical protein